jgi:hypothetical protein
MAVGFFDPLIVSVFRMTALRATHGAVIHVFPLVVRLMPAPHFDESGQQSRPKSAHTADRYA